jgi:hypothetical protein
MVRTFAERAEMPSAPPPAALQAADLARLNERLAVRGAGEVAIRSVYPTGESLFALDISTDPVERTARARLWEVNRRSGEVFELGHAESRDESGRFVSSATTAEGARVRSSREDPDPPGLGCGSCVLAGIVGGVLLGSVCAGTGILCNIASALFGAGVTTACTAAGCPVPALGSGFVINETACQFASCDLGIMIYNPPSATTQSVSSWINWWYPPGSWGTTKGGFQQSALADAEYAALPFNTPGQYYRIAWTHQGSDPTFQQCTTTADISITVQWSNYDFATTEIVPHSKLFLQGCPGQHYVGVG